MADKGRDLKVSILSDADKFDLTAPAGDLDDLGGKAQDAGRDLDRLADDAGTTAGDLNRLAREANGAGSDLTDLQGDARQAAGEFDDLGRRSRDAGDDVDRAARDAADSVDRLGTDAKSAAQRVEGSFRDIAQAAKRGGDSVDKAGDQGRRSLDEMGEEGQGTAREMAASFDGTADGIKDAMQEAATNVLAALGPVGAAIGVGAGVAIGFIRGEAEKAKEAVGELVGELIDAGGRLSNQSVLTQLRKFAEDGTITDLAAEARQAKVDVADYLRAMAGDPDALARTTAGIDSARQAAERQSDALRAANAVTVESGRASSDQAVALANMSDNLDDTAGRYALATEASQAYLDATGLNQEAVETFAAALGDWTDPAGVYSDTLSALETAERDRAQAAADATKDTTDTWEDLAKDVDVSVDDYLDSLQKTIEAQEDWAANMQTLARRGVDQGVLEQLARMGPEGAPLVAKLTSASDKELDRMNALFKRQGAAAATGVAESIAAGRPAIGREVQEIREDARRRLSNPVNLPTTITGPGGAAIAAVRRDVQNGLRPVVIPTMLQAVPTSTWSRYIP
jgi:hypothetical protein